VTDIFGIKVLITVADMDAGTVLEQGQ